MDSSGVDVRARRELWDILLKYKNNKTMMISTHYMDEAEALADRIVIISKGKMKVSGTTNFLKNKLGQGYHLNLSVGKEAKIDAITHFIKEIIPGSV